LAFHPVDGYAQSMPYQYVDAAFTISFRLNLIVELLCSIIPYILPINKFVYFGMFMIVNLWTILVSPRVFSMYMFPC
jgi:hypothetical protein